MSKLTECEIEAWRIYCADTAGGLNVADFWHDLSDGVKDSYICRAMEATLFLPTPGLHKCIQEMHAKHPNNNPESPTMNRSHILETAESHITTDRAATHGSAENSFSDMAGGWNWWCSIRASGTFDSHDVAVMMTIFKIARIAGNAGHADNYIDAAGYIALAGEIAGAD